MHRLIIVCTYCECIITLVDALSSAVDEQKVMMCGVLYGLDARISSVFARWSPCIQLNLQLIM